MTTIKFNGFNPDFLKDKLIKQKVALPQLNKEQIKDLAPVSDNQKGILHYQNFSLQLSASRKFPFYTASNINGKLFKKADRAASWKKDNRVNKHQWGTELYSAAKSDFDKGHMTRREEVQWGKSYENAQKAADATFFYPNAVPQHKNLNQVIWKSLEDYILHTEAVGHALKICVFTGPVLSPDDPDFSSTVNGTKIKIPTLFWKVVVFPKADGKLYRVGFLMSQAKLLRDNDITEEMLAPLAKPTSITFNEFEEADTYQVNIMQIEELTGLTFPKAIDAYKDSRSLKLVLREIEVPGMVEKGTMVAKGTMAAANGPSNFFIDNLTL